jgi:hypothetical protein
MTITPLLIGGFGNRLYQIANAIRLKNEYDLDLLLYNVIPEPKDVDRFRHLILRPSDLDEFGGHQISTTKLPTTLRDIFSGLTFNAESVSVDTLLNNKQLYDEQYIHLFQPLTNTVVSGYYFNYNYVGDSVQELRNSFNPTIDKYINDTYHSVLDGKTLGMHLRLGIGTDNNPAIHVPCEFYNNVINLKKGDLDRIVVVSDNSEKAKSYVSNLKTYDIPVLYVTNEPMYIDMLLLSMCSYLAIAPSTLSAWSTYFSTSDSIYVPSVWIPHHRVNNINNKWIIF